MIQLGQQEIPRYHVIKRWTIDARDNLPGHLIHYQRDRAPQKGATFRHNALYLSALELVQKGDRNVAAFDRAMDILIAANAELDIIGAVKDGKGLAENLESNGDSAFADTCSVGNNIHCPADCTSDNENGRVVRNVSVSSVSADHTQSDVSAPERRKRKGRPTTSRDKPGYEITDKRSRFCTICRGKGHKSTTCPSRGDLPKKPRKEPTCGVCGVAGHRRNNCIKPVPGVML